MSENKLPKGWVECKLGDILTLKNGYAFKSTEYKEIGIPLIRISDIFNQKVNIANSVNIPTEFFKKEFQVEEGDILIAMSGATTGKIGIYENSIVSLQNQRVGNFKLYSDKYFNKRLLFYLLLDLKKTIEDSAYGGAQPNISANKIESLKISIPPLQEQQRIVAKLDSIMEKIELNKERLVQIPKILKRFRQSVLAVAVSGEGNEDITKNICDEIQIGPFGTQLHKHDYISNGIPLVNPTHIQNGEIIPNLDLTITKEKFNELPNYHLKKEDIIMGRRGEMARCALIGENENGWFCGTGSLFFRPNQKKVDPQYLYWQLSNQNTKSFLENEAKGSTMSNLNLTIVKNIPILISTLKEQEAIVYKVEQLFAFADKLEERYLKAKTMLDKLPQSILAKAFRGELVEQDENDEDASLLLERIKEERGGNVIKLRKRLSG